MDYDYLTNKVLPISFIVFGVVALSYAVYNYETVQTPLTEPIQTNFNGRDFLLTGGSVKPETIDELRVELQRLNWLHNGGSNQ